MKPRKFNLTSDRLKELLDYDAAIGIFTWKVKPAKRCPAGSVAGGVHRSTGYVRMNVDGLSYLAHRLAWAYMTGDEPPDVVDHIDGDRTNNRWSNLRASTSSHNLQNLKGATKRNKLGALGVRRSGAAGFKAVINIDGNDKHIGSFSTLEAASSAYLEAKRRFHAGCTL